MKAVVTQGVGGPEQLSYQDVPAPVPLAGEVLLRVLAAGVNNTEINTRLGWYSASVTSGTDDAAKDTGSDRSDGGWNARTPFPFIQGTDCCGEVVELGDGVSDLPLGQRVLVRASMRPKGFDDPENIWLGSDFDGAFAEFVKVPASEVFAVNCDWSDAELASIPCAFGTAENMLHRAEVGAGDRVLVPGASGGVGSAVVQLARRRGAEVIALTSPGKEAAVKALGAHQVIARPEDPLEVLGIEAVDVVVDNVGGDRFPKMIESLRRRGRYVTSGAIAGPMVALDMRSLYLKDLRLIGCTGWDAPVFPDLIGYIERGEIRPRVDRTYALADIAQAQEDFTAKAHIGKFVLLPW